MSLTKEMTQEEYIKIKDGYIKLHDAGKITMERFMELMGEHAKHFKVEWLPKNHHLRKIASRKKLAKFIREGK